MSTNLYCPECGDSFGKDKENHKWVSCANCGHEKIWNEEGYDNYEEEDNDEDRE